MGEKDVCLLALAGVSPVCLPKEAIGLIPDLRKWTEASAGSSAGCHSTLQLTKNPGQVYLPVCLS